jgi:hypothetical protein
MPLACLVAAPLLCALLPSVACWLMAIGPLNELATQLEQCRHCGLPLALADRPPELSTVVAGSAQVFRFSRRLRAHR